MLRITVGECTVIPSLNVVERQGSPPIKLAPRTMDLLVYLVRHKDEVVSVDELIAGVWHGRIVNATQIYKGIGQLREIVAGDHNDRAIIQTIPKRGYRLSAASVSSNSESLLRVSPHPTAPSRNRSALARGELAALVTLGGLVLYSSTEDTIERAGILGADSAITLTDSSERALAAPAFESLSLDTSKMKQGLPGKQTTSPEAYSYYVRSGVETAAGFDAASRHLYLDRALALDPDFAQAHARKASVYALSLVDNTAVGSAGFAPFEALAAKVYAHAQKALALDSSLTDAHLALARLHQYRWDWAQAKTAYEKALALSPTSLDVLRAYSHFSSYRGDGELGLELATRALELYPEEAATHFRMGTVLLNSRATSEAIRAFKDAIRFEPTYTLAHIYLGIAEASRASHEDAATELRVAEQLISEHPTPDYLALIAYGYSLVGSESDAERVVRQLETESSRSNVGVGNWIFASLALHRTQEALDWLAAAADKIKRSEPDVSYYNLMLIKRNAFADSRLEQSDF